MATLLLDANILVHYVRRDAVWTRSSSRFATGLIPRCLDRNGVTTIPGVSQTGVVAQRRGGSRNHETTKARMEEVISRFRTFVIS